MPSRKPKLILVHEPEKACFNRLFADGHASQRATEIASYLAQSTDLAPEFDVLGRACHARGLSFTPVALDDAASVLAGEHPSTTLVWTLT
ncbi:D-alanine:D-lactate ligase-like protein, partial [Mesorhizobium sp. M7A.F.Ca.CA.001.09.2.1]